MNSRFQFDVFIDHAATDAPWIRDSLLPRLEAVGLRVGVDFRDFEVGRSSSENRARLLGESQWTLLVLTPAWLKGEWTGLEAVLNQSEDPAALLRQFLPVMLEKCELPKVLAPLLHTDLTDVRRRPRELNRLADSLRKSISLRAKSPEKDISAAAAGDSDAVSERYVPPHGVSLAWEKPIGGRPRVVGWSSNGNILAVYGEIGSAYVFNKNGVPRPGIDGWRGDLGASSEFAWSPVRSLLAAVVHDRIMFYEPSRGEVRWEVAKPLPASREAAWTIAWKPDGTALALANEYGEIYVASLVRFDLKRLAKLRGGISSLSWSMDGTRLAASLRSNISVVDASSGEVLVRAGIAQVNRSLWLAEGLVVSVGDGTIRVFDDDTLRQVHALEGHEQSVGPLAVSSDGRILASGSLDDTVRLWRCDRWEQVGVLGAMASTTNALSVSRDNLLAMGGVGRESIRVWKMDVDRLLADSASSLAVYYRNAKAVLVGDSSVGKSGLGLVLSAQSYKATDSTHGRRVWNFETSQVELEGNRRETRETFLWDLAGQPGYRLIHQLHLDDVAVALVVFDAKSETDPFAGVGHWERALRTAVRVQGSGAPPLRKFLVAARTDRSGIAATKERIEAKVKDLGFDGYFETSAREGWGIEELKSALRDAVSWDKLPQVSSTELFRSIKEFLVEEKKSGRLLGSTEDLYFSFVRQQGHQDAERDQFNICLGRLESRDLIRRLSFGGLVLLQPEYLDAYASAIVNEAKAEPDGLGSINEQKVLQAGFRISKDERISDAERERLLLVATVEDMVRREIALREHEQDGTQLVFPSQLTRENPDLPEAKGKAVVFSFEGPTQNIYATLAVRLSHSQVFARKEMWRNAVVFNARIGGGCGVALREYGEGRGDLIIFFDAATRPETRLLFEEYVESHLRGRAIPQSIFRRPVVGCLDCGTEVSTEVVEKRLARGYDTLSCPVCDKRVSLHSDVPSGLRQTLELAEMDRAADDARDREAALLSAAAALSTAEFSRWLGSSNATLVIAFVSMRTSSPPGREIGQVEAERQRQVRFEQVRLLVRDNAGYEVKELGSSLLIGFRTVGQAFAFTLKLRASLEASVALRVAMDADDVSPTEKDTFSRIVTQVARMEAQASEGRVWISNRVRQALDAGASPSPLQWTKHDGSALAAVTGGHALWSADLDLPVVVPVLETIRRPEPAVRVTIVLEAEAGGADRIGESATWLVNKLGGKVLQSKRVQRTMTLEYDCSDLGELLRLAENGLLDGMLGEVGARSVREILADGACLYEEMPIVDPSPFRLKSVDTATIEGLIGKVDVVLMTTTPIEREAVLSAMSPLSKRKALLEGPFNNITYRLGRFGRYSAAHVESTMGTTGRAGATLTVSDVIKDFQPKAIIVPGIAFGIDRKKQRLGDVLVAESVFPYELRREGESSIYRGQELPCGSILSERFLSGSRSWIQHRPSGLVKVHSGLVLSGEKLIDNKAFRDQLLSEFPTARGGEMEGVGVYASGIRSRVETILVKAICDWADGHKNDRAQPFAAKMAVSLVHHVLSKPDVLRALGATES
ncbi:MAG: TIR domain-containing protein [Acidovorax sp.]|nr:MAG: TIR domain-containing protein [Acidovorax sp.]